MKRDIVVYGNQVLRNVALKVDAIDDDLKKLANDMIDTMLDVKGVGLAAPQVGISKQVFVANLTPDRASSQVFVNPEILKVEGDENSEEGCLSVPGVVLDVKRANRVLFKYLDIDGKEVEIWADGLFARVIQHEMDHLNGILIVDKVSKVRRILISPHLKKLAKSGKAPKL